jgi:nicotinamide mononucleotide transporter
LTAAAIAAIAWLLSRHTDSPVPVADATVTGLSLAATYGQARKLVESWWIWIAVDVVSVPLYISRGLYPTAALYFVFGCLCVAGLRSWRRELSQSPRP